MVSPPYLGCVGVCSLTTSEYAAAFFLLADHLHDAVNVCLNQLKDLQLAITVARVYEGDTGPVLRRLLEEEVLTIAAQEGNRWLASWAFWMLHRRDMAVRALIVSTTAEQRHARKKTNDDKCLVLLLHKPRRVRRNYYHHHHYHRVPSADHRDECVFRAAPQTPVYTLLETPGSPDLKSRLFLTDDPALVILYSQLRQMSLQTIRGASKVTPKVEWEFVLHNARLYDRMGCDLLGLDLGTSPHYHCLLFLPPIICLG